MCAGRRTGAVIRDGWQGRSALSAGAPMSCSGAHLLSMETKELALGAPADPSPTQTEE